MMSNQSINFHYTEIIRKQNENNKLLEEAVKTLKKRNKELSRRCELYKENILYWKEKHDSLQECLIDVKVKCVNITEQNAIDAYKSNQ